MKRELHVISNGRLSFLQMAEIAVELKGFLDYLHIRERSLSTRELYEGVMLLLDRGIAPSQLVINDRVDVALLTGVKRVQLGYNSAPVSIVKERFPMLHVGCSVHSLAQAHARQLEGADSLIYGHVFQTRSKDGLAPRGLHELSHITSQIAIPTVAIGGIKPIHVDKVLEAGVKGIAVMSSIWDAASPAQAASSYIQHIQRWCEHEQGV